MRANHLPSVLPAAARQRSSDRLQTLTCYSALTFIALIVIATLPHHLF
jgi:hypothetical protein